MSKQGLTPRQSDIYRFLVAYHKEYGVYPSMREIAEGKIEGEQVITKVSASSAVKLTLDRLESRGWIRKGKHIHVAWKFCNGKGRRNSFHIRTCQKISCRI